MPSKVLTLASEKEREEAERAIFQRWRRDTLAQTGAADLDCDLQGNPLPVQITTRYVGPPPPVVALDANGIPLRDPKTGDFVIAVPSDPKALLIDGVVEAMHGEVEPVALDAAAVYQVTGAAEVDPETGKVEVPIVIAEDGGKTADGKLIDGVPCKLVAIDVSAAVPWEPNNTGAKAEAIELAAEPAKRFGAFAARAPKPGVLATYRRAGILLASAGGAAAASIAVVHEHQALVGFAAASVAAVLAWIATKPKDQP